MNRVIVLKWNLVSLIIPEKQDIEIMFQNMNNYELTRFLWPVKFYTREQEEKFLNKVLSWEHKFFIIYENKSEKVVWWVAFNDLSDVNRNWTIWISLYWEGNLWKWYGTEAMNLFLKYSFKILWLNKVKLHVYANNPRAIKSYEKCGFQKVWLFKQEAYIMWEYVDSIQMEILRTEYENLEK